MTPLGQGETLPNLLCLNSFTEETRRRSENKGNDTEMISTDFSDF